MTVAIEVLYHAPPDLAREERIGLFVQKIGGKLDFREIPAPGDVSQAVCLTYEFDDRSACEKAASALRGQGEHVEGPFDYD